MLSYQEIAAYIKSSIKVYDKYKGKVVYLIGVDLNKGIHVGDHLEQYYTTKDNIKLYLHSIDKIKDLYDEICDYSMKYSGIDNSRMTAIIEGSIQSPFVNMPLWFTGFCKEYKIDMFGIISRGDGVDLGQCTDE